jgi:hypothetical protein
MPQIGEIILKNVKDASRPGGIKRLSHIYVSCEYCGKERWVLLKDWKRGEGKHCHACGCKHQRHNPESTHWGKDNPNWKGGKMTDKNGYTMILINPQDPFYSMAGSKGTQTRQRYIREHRLVMAQALNRLLSPKEIVHHIDGNPSNNKLGNLELCDAGNHKLSYRAGYSKGFADGVEYGKSLKSEQIHWNLFPENPRQTVKVLV